MKKMIRTGGDKVGIAKQVQGLTVDATPHPKYKGLWQFEFMGETWVATNYSFKEE